MVLARVLININYKTSIGLIHCETFIGVHPVMVWAVANVTAVNQLLIGLYQRYVA
jgi:hypothetical protein